ncbi:MAG TPA: hypothetical protein VMX55_00230 [candidate division Zixibacteria bacterium]|nr:hypothetical protein [candidate division Zixibacteria bacterium]
MLVTKSFAEIIDDHNELYFKNKLLKNNSSDDLIKFICSRQIQESFKKGSFSFSPRDYQLGKWLFTGERIVTNLAIRNILSMDATRILLFNRKQSENVNEVIEKSHVWMEHSCFSKFCTTGECKHSSTAFARYFVTLDQEENEIRLNDFVKTLSNFRNNKGKWGGFPFYYTLLALLEIQTSKAKKELQFAAPACEKNLKQLSNINPKYSERRLEIIKRVLAKTYSIF